MKSLIKLLSLSIVVFACSKQEETKVQTTKLTGTITNPKGDIVNLKFGGDRLIDTLDANNSFEFEFVIDEPTDMTFQHGEYAYVYLHPGDSLNMTLDTDKFDETLKYSGDAAKQNQYLVAKVLVESVGMPRETLYAKKEAEFLTTVDSLLNVNNDLLNSYVTKEEDGEFIKQQRLANQYEALAKKIRYENYYPHFSKDTTQELSKDYYAFYDQLDMNNESLLKNNAYVSVLEQYIEYKSNLYDDFDFSNKYWTPVLDKAITTIDEEISNNKVRLKLYNNYYVPQFLSKVEADFAESLLVKIDSMDTEKQYITKLNEQWDGLKKVAIGQPVPEMTFEDIDGNPVTLASLKGKMVYIDVWATWCGPCMRELPHLEKLQEDLKDNNVAFVSVSIDDTRDPWKKMVEKKEMKGIQLYSEGAWSSEIIKNFVVKGIPRFILLDENGIIVDNDAARPSGNIKEVILEELEG